MVSAHRTSRTLRSNFTSNLNTQAFVCVGYCGAGDPLFGFYLSYLLTHRLCTAAVEYLIKDRTHVGFEIAALGVPSIFNVHSQMKWDLQWQRHVHKRR